MTYAGPIPREPWKYALAFENNAPNYYAVTIGKWGAPTIAKVYGTEADARVIAAAPELLAALDRMELLFSRDWCSGDNAARESALTFARVVLSKARGES